MECPLTIIFSMFCHLTQMFFIPVNLMTLNEIPVGPSHAWKGYGRTNCKCVILLDVQHCRAKEFLCKPSEVTDRGYLLLNISILEQSLAT